MLESPTGTGKTMCLLAASLAWRQEKAKQLEEAQLAMAEHAALFVGDNLTNEALEEEVIMKPKPPVIIYASRTHSQISQVVSELRRTTYFNSLNICVLGSRSQMCIHPTVSQTKGGMGAINRACNARVRRSACTFHAKTELYKSSLPRTCDIEDLIMWGRRNSACPYYIAKDQQAIADIVFLPYNYIIDPLIRSSLTVELKGSVIILDEAHNLENVCNDAASFELSSTDLKLCLTAIQQCVDMSGEFSLPDLGPIGLAARNTKNTTSKEDEDLPPLAESTPPGYTVQVGVDDDDDWTTGTADAALLKEALTSLMTEIASIAFSGGANVKVSEGQWVYDMFARVGITGETAPGYLRTVERVAYWLSSDNGMVQMQPTSSSTSNSYASANALSSFGECLRKMFMTGVPVTEASSHIKSVLQRDLVGSSASKTHVSNPTSSDNTSFVPFDTSVDGKNDQQPKMASSTSSNRSGPFDRQWNYKLSLWCFYPGLAMQSLMNTGVRSLIVTSGTLSPLDSFAYELSIPFPIRLENPHVIPTSQIWVGVLSTAVDGEILNSAFENRSEQYKRSLGHTLINVARISPGGMLVFFPSYRMMEDCIAVWRNVSQTESNIWDQICRYKHPVLEPKESNKLKLAMKDFYDKVDKPSVGELNGAVFFAVCRGKVSEGLDFSNHYGRTVVVTGLPFAQNKDQKVKLKREYLDAQVMKRSALAKQQTKQASLVSVSDADSSDAASDGHEMTDKPLTGADWYAQSAWRAVNQAIGRVIRHRNDYGAILFMDDRFVGSAHIHLSKWLRPHIHTIRSPGTAFQAMSKFFQHNSLKFPVVTPNETSLSLSSSSSSSSTTTTNQHSLITDNDESKSSRKEMISHISAANARRKSVFDSVTSPTSTNAATMEKTPTISPSPKPNAVDRGSEKSQKANQLLLLARSQLGPTAFQEFQIAVKKFRGRKITRSELMKQLTVALAQFPDFLTALNEYLPSAPPTTSELASPQQINSPPLNYPATSSQTKSNMASFPTPTPPSHFLVSKTDIFNAASSLDPIGTSHTPTSTSLDHKNAEKVDEFGSPDAPPETFISVDSPSLEIVSEPLSKKRAHAMSPSSEVEPQSKRLHPSVHFRNPAESSRFASSSRRVDSEAIPDDSILDVSSSNPLDVIPPPVYPTHPIDLQSSSIEVISQFHNLSNDDRPKSTTPQTKRSRESVSLQFIGTYGAEDEDFTELPMLGRKSSSDISPKHTIGVDSTWLQGLTRGNSGGLASDRTLPSERASSSEFGSNAWSPQTSQTSQTKSPYMTPKKRQGEFVDLITGKVAPTPKSTPKRVSPPKPKSKPEMISDSAPEPISFEDSQSTDCPICAKTTSNFRTAPCGHSCCFDCWQGWLAQKMECPFCRGRVRVKKLEKTKERNSK
jgi:regulator of telomere elongation helicase 1